jgi:hypothetical protein
LIKNRQGLSAGSAWSQLDRQPPRSLEKSGSVSVSSRGHKATFGEEPRMAEDQVTQHEAKQIDELHRQVMEQAKAVAVPDPCVYWRLIKPYWPLILRLIRLIPVVGGKIADILEAIGKALDHLCK